MIICVVFFDSENAVGTTMSVFYRDSNNSKSCKRLDKSKRKRRSGKRKRKSYSISQ
jgi:hypothetical protein